VRIDPALVMAAALLGGAACAVAPLPAVMAAAALALLLRPRLGPAALLVSAAAFGLGAWRAERAVSRFEARRVEVRDELGPPARCAGRGVVATSPVWAHDAIGYLADFRGLDCEGRKIPGPVRARLYGGPQHLGRGDVVEIVAQLAPVRLFHDQGLPDPTPRAARQGSLLSGMVLSLSVIHRGSGWRRIIDTARAHARRRIDATFAPAAAPMARALVLGENDLDPRDDEAFRKSGLAHMLAVSGTHLVFAVVALVAVFGFVLVRFERLAARIEVARLAAAAGVLLALVYADFAGGSGSAWRAAWMLAAAFTARALGRRARAGRVLAASLLIGALSDPLAAFDISFLLSAAATVGLIVIGQPLAARCMRLQFKPLRYLALSAAATSSAMLPCAPLLALISPTLTAAGIAANVVAAPFGEAAALPLCLAHAVLSPFPVLERGTALVASGALLVVKRVAHLSADARWLAFHVPPPDAWQLAVLVVGGVAVALGGRFRGLWALSMAAALLVLELAIRRAGRPLGELRVTAVDVGQGDCTLVDLPDGQLMLVDGGGFVGSPVDPGKSVILPLLRARRRSRVDIVVLTHPHPDHFTGLASALPELAVGQFWDDGQGQDEGAGATYAGLVAGLRRRRVPILRPPQLCGRVLHFGGATLQPLAPCPDYTPHIGANNNSIVLRIAYGRRAVMLMGDAEAPEEAKILAKHPRGLRADLLKVGHHGSRTSSTPALLRAVRPALASISSGVRNRYGHPHGVTLEKLAAAHIRALRLDRVGSVTFETDGSTLGARTFSAPH
jgi:competence protein ComEC